MIYFKNTLSGKIEEFVPINPDLKEVGMYNCGPTVYGKVHIGNLRAYIFADLIKNTLIYNGYKVKQVINITDVGHLVADSDDGADKVEEQAKKENLDALQITQKYTDYFMEKLKELSINTDGTLFPKASDNIPEQIEMIQKLESEGYAYTTSDGVYFDTSKFADYGTLGNINIEGLKEGARVETNTEKRNVTDFALWKFSKEKRQQEWESPWGVGFPGWHIECSAMSKKFLGETFDIHTGGVDHIPTHHNNEIAQSVCSNHAPFAKYWLHVNHITIDGKKISKSIGNTLYLEDLEAKGISPRAYKYWLYTSHYSTLSNFTFEAVSAAQTAVNKLFLYIKKNNSDQLGSINQEYKDNFMTFLNQDLDTPKAIALIWEMLKDDSLSDIDKRKTLLNFDIVLGLDIEGQKELIDALIPKQVQALAQKRKDARTNRDFALADALREEIESAGFEIKDTDTEIGYQIAKK